MLPKKGNSNTQERIALMEQVIALLGDYVLKRTEKAFVGNKIYWTDWIILGNRFKTPRPALAWRKESRSEVGFSSLINAPSQS